MTLYMNVILSIFLGVFVMSCANRSKILYFNETDTCVCGRDEFAPRIVGGEAAEPNQYPWMAAIFNQGRIHCGGSLINDRYILTAGHCLAWNKKSDLSVVLGLHDRFLMETERKGGIAAEIEKIIIHEDFSSDYLHDTDDIGLIKLKEAIKFTSAISPICLPQNDDDYSEKKALVMGWGKTGQRAAPSQILRRANVTVLSNDECRKVSAIGKHIMDSMLCAHENEIDACQGDSGGPLIHESVSGIIELIGIVSWGIGCAKPGVPGVYTRTSSYLDWISLYTRDTKYCSYPT